MGIRIENQEDFEKALKDGRLEVTETLSERTGTLMVVSHETGRLFVVVTK